MQSLEDSFSPKNVPFLFSFLVAIFSFSYAAPPTTTVDSPADLNLLTQTIAERFNTYIDIFQDDIQKHLDFCIKDVKSEFNAAFNFSENTHFLADCIVQTKGDALQRICTAGEIDFYAKSLMRMGDQLKLNRNCNLSSWVSGCEPGWACTVGANNTVDHKIRETPLRTSNCQPCCAGFFCPRGLTCMIPCPLGAYCPVSTINSDTGVCDPYRYTLPLGLANHTCGGADRWADIKSGPDLFCSASNYCPTTTQEIPCSKGYYCRAGTTAKQKCYKFAFCDKQTDTQNITAYGVFFFSGIMVILIFIYNCSDQVLSAREKRRAKSREAAAKSVRETAQSQARWKTAKEVAKKQVSGIQRQLSRTFSRRKSSREQTKDVPEASLPPVHPHQSKGKEKEIDLSVMMQELEEDPESHDGFSLDMVNEPIKRQEQSVKPRHKQTKSQIFRYAYGQIEKEKAFQEQNKNLTFSGVIQMASEIEIRARLPIEIIFKDLTLTLKGKKKHLLRCVTGKLSPGRVSAVMGPSGAGKTTFLSALTGRATGCNMTGLILINEERASMQSYKKIIGFVPQDDIVHGNLTVEENLWFSARCRLPVDLPKPEKVLVVERVIESLGLQTVRDSLVGTVEKRGISGGQRKRVNVGLEMVMEPSLLILDEPTSGLDSASSLLLLRALRREALEGVNICMVVHQPSYALFKMFDDLILLAKGGLTVYHGPVKKAEEYFSGLGIHVPDRVNPPDHYIDILEGIVKSSTSGVSFKDLPLRWMLHNGYPVPPDMLDSSEMSASSSTVGENSPRASSSGTPTGTVAGELWGDFKSSVEQRKDDLKNKIGMARDLSKREVPGVFRQYRYFLGRLMKQRLREARVQAVDFLILLLAGICLGNLAKVSDETFGARGYLYTVIAVSLLCKIGALRSFSLDKLHYWRESASGMSSLAYFLAKDTIDHINTVVKPAVYLSMFYFFNNPRSTVWDNYFVLLALVYCVTGIAYSLAIYFDPGQAQLWSVLLPVVLTLVANQDGDELVNIIGDFCYTKWALEAFMIANAKRYSGVWLITRCGLLQQRHFQLRHWYPCLGYLVATGICSRAIAFFCLVTFQKR